MNNTAGHVPPEWERWRGGVDQKLDTIDRNVDALDGKIDKNATTLNSMPDEIERRMGKLINGKASVPNPSKGQPITFKWITEKALLPILMLIAGLMIAQLIG